MNCAWGMWSGDCGINAGEHVWCDHCDKLRCHLRAWEVAFARYV